MRRDKTLKVCANHYCKNRTPIIMGHFAASLNCSFFPVAPTRTHRIHSPHYTHLSRHLIFRYAPVSLWAPLPSILGLQPPISSSSYPLHPFPLPPQTNPPTYDTLQCLIPSSPTTHNPTQHTISRPVSHSFPSSTHNSVPPHLTQSCASSFRPRTHSTNITSFELIILPHALRRSIWRDEASVRAK